MQSTDQPRARRITGLAAVALIACATAIVPSAASAKTRARAAQDSTGSVSSTPTLSSAAIAAGRAQFGANATTQQVLQAYWTPDRMRAAKPVDSAPFFTTAYQRFALT